MKHDRKRSSFLQRGSGDGFRSSLERKLAGKYFPLLYKCFVYWESTCLGRTYSGSWDSWDKVVSSFHYCLCLTSVPTRYSLYFQVSSERSSIWLLPEMWIDPQIFRAVDERSFSLKTLQTFVHSTFLQTTYVGWNTYPTVNLLKH